jgi:hypothetical protein
LPVAGLGEQPVGAQRGAGLLHPRGRRAEPRAGEQARARRLQHGRRLRGPLEEAARRGVAGQPAVLEDQDAVRGAQAPLQAVLGEDDRRPPLLVQPAQEPHELVARDGIELGGRLVEQDELRATGERGAERDPLQLAARELVGRALEQGADPEGERDLLDPPGHRGGPQAAVLEREGELRADRAEDGLGLGILQQGAGHRGELRGTVLARVQAADDDAAAELPAVEVRHQAAERAQQRALAAGRRAGHHDELPGLDRE